MNVSYLRSSSSPFDDLQHLFRRRSWMELAIADNSTSAAVATAFRVALTTDGVGPSRAMAGIGSMMILLPVMGL